jgi:hypothetical protein
MRPRPKTQIVTGTQKARNRHAIRPIMRFSNTPSIAITAPIVINYGRIATSSAGATDPSGVARSDTDLAKRSAPTAPIAATATRT